MKTQSFFKQYNDFVQNEQKCCAVKKKTKISKNKLYHDKIYVYRHNDHEIEQARFLINNYIKTQWKEVKKYLGERTQMK